MRTRRVETRAESTTLSDEAIQELCAALRGDVITAGDQAFDEARRVWNGLIDKRPALIARCAEAADVIAAVNFARGYGVPLSVRGGGHNVAGKALCDEGLVIDLSDMRGVHVDPATRVVRAEGGALLGDIDRRTQMFGLAVPLGVVSQTGVAGLCLHGGMGWLTRKHGLTLDNLIDVDIVTADGRLRRAGEAENPDSVSAEIFRRVGEYLAITWKETQYILEPACASRALFGRLVKTDACFKLIDEGAKRIVKDIRQFAADDALANSPLMKQLAAHPHYTIAQFAQAVGAIYFGCTGLKK